MSIRVEDLEGTDFAAVAQPGAPRIRPIHPGEVLLEEFLLPMGITQYRLAKETHVPQRRIGLIVAGKRDVTADTAMRLGRFFGMSAEFWMALQAGYEMAVARDAMADELAAIKPWPAALAAA